MYRMVSTFWKDERGATAIEYAVIASILSLAVVGGAFSIGQTLDGIFSDVSNGF